LCVTNGRILAGWNIGSNGSDFVKNKTFQLTPKMLGLSKEKFVEIEGDGDKIKVDNTLVINALEYSSPNAEAVLKPALDSYKKPEGYTKIDPYSLVALDKFWPDFWHEVPRQATPTSPCLWEGAEKFILVMPRR
jgi:hypothetical protein